MIVTLLDTCTRQRCRIYAAVRAWEWAKNNWSCDCNRAMAFERRRGGNVDCQSAYASATEPVRNTCAGAKRYLVIEAYSDDEEDRNFTLLDLNDDYPHILVEKHLGALQFNNVSPLTGYHKYLQETRKI